MFNFNTVTTEDFVNEINKLNSKKSSTGVSISSLKENVDVCAPKLTEIFNSCILKGIFSDELKVADISPIFKSEVWGLVLGPLLFNIYINDLF